MSKTRVTISLNDLFAYRLKDAQTTIEWFGQDYLDDYGVDIPDELLAEYNAIMQQYNDLQYKLRDIDNKKSSE